MPLIDLEKVEFKSEKLQGLVSFIKRTASTPAPIHISGEAGTGKTTWAVWLKSKWPSLSSVECDAADLDVAEFRNQVQAFTSGLILIENIDLLSLELQKELNEFLEKRNNSNQIKLISTSRKSLKELVVAGEFRSDLYYKVTVLQVELPSLAKVREEIPVICDFYIRVFEILYKKNGIRLTEGAQEKLQHSMWTGNISELESVIERAVALSQNGIIDEEQIIFQIQPELRTMEIPEGISLSEMERRLILQTLHLADNNRTRAAHILGISIRTLRNKLNEYKEAGLL